MPKLQKYPCRRETPKQRKMEMLTSECPWINSQGLEEKAVKEEPTYLLNADAATKGNNKPKHERVTRGLGHH
ncbi:Protein of unknown function [Pyronema omphalodes CBS 100304]|uniref:Uncharacterized protein n=1 Tax=Pyronema omphalodes (strain CBS 100304) TaxID=1076935 RepID=U4KVZ6_PYROM|nr:Protein of unknown function [Pyronema omphalodes CBS 100304]